jgi:cell division protein FtsB
MNDQPDPVEVLRQENDELKKKIAALQAQNRSLFLQLEAIKRQARRSHEFQRDYLEYPDEDDR